MFFSMVDCLVNSKMVEKSMLKDCCLVEDNPSDIKSKIEELMSIEITSLEKEKRKNIVEKNYSNQKNAELIISHL